MKRFLYKASLILMVCGLTACGYSLNELYDGDSFNSINFADNYYTRWDSDIAYKEAKNKITNPGVKTINLDKSTDYVFTKFSDDNFSLVEPSYHNYIYNNDYSETEDESGLYPYGPNNNLSDIDDSFRYGFISRLFDGELFCDGNYEKARVQLNTNGFGRTLNKELYSASYFAISFKTSIEFRRVAQNNDGDEINIDIARWWLGNGENLAHTCDIGLTINFYLKNENGYERVPIFYEISDVPCNYSDDSQRTNYVLFGFEIGNSVETLSRCAGISIEYSYEDDLLNQMNADMAAKNLANASNSYFDNHESDRYLYGDEIQHSILLYEVMFPHSIWH
ncbi:MAG: hypothetical protein WC201_02070 [Bacilli bacterium]